jgi:hypothetical protein
MQQIKLETLFYLNCFKIVGNSKNKEKIETIENYFQS